MFNQNVGQPAAGRPGIVHLSGSLLLSHVPKERCLRPRGEDLADRTSSRNLPSAHRKKLAEPQQDMNNHLEAQQSAIEQQVWRLLSLRAIRSLHPKAYRVRLTFSEILKSWESRIYRSMVVDPGLVKGGCSFFVGTLRVLLVRHALFHRANTE